MRFEKQYGKKNTNSNFQATAEKTQTKKQLFFEKFKKHQNSETIIFKHSLILDP